VKYQDFRTNLMSFINRKDIPVAQVDFFVNMAKTGLQLERNFNFTRKTAALVYPSSVGVGLPLPSDFKGMVSQRSVSLGVNGVNRPLLGESFSQRQRRMQQACPLPSITTALVPVPQTGIVYRVEWLNEVPSLLLFPEVTDAQLQVWYYSWIADYGDDLNREDFLLKYAGDCLLWEALRVQNRFVKEEARVPVDEMSYQAALTRLVEYDARIPDDGARTDLS
jgi:hypothetical protein